MKHFDALFKFIEIKASYFIVVKSQRMTKITRSQFNK